LAKKRKSSQSGASNKAAEETTPETIDAIAEDVTETPADEPVTQPEAETPDAEEAAVEDTSTDKAGIETKPIKELLSEMDHDDTADTPQPDPTPEPAAPEERATPAPVPQPVHHDSASNHVLLPAILGGLIAAAIGFGVAYYILPRPDAEMGSNVAANASELEAVRGEVAALSEATQNIDLTPVTGQIDELRGQITGEIDVLAERISVFDGAA